MQQQCSSVTVVVVVVVVVVGIEAASSICYWTIPGCSAMPAQRSAHLAHVHSQWPPPAPVCLEFIDRQFDTLIGSGC